MNALDVPAAHAAMLHKIRNLGRPGIVSMAISAVDNALWDLKARLLNCSLLDLLGAARDGAEIYGSGGFTSYTIEKLQEQLGGWAADGIQSVKMKIGRDPKADLRSSPLGEKSHRLGCGTVCGRQRGLHPQTGSGPSGEVRGARCSLV